MRPSGLSSIIEPSYIDPSDRVTLIKNNMILSSK